MNSLLRLVAAAALVVGAALATMGAAPPAGVSDADGVAACDGARLSDPALTLAGLSDGPTLRVEHARDALIVSDRASGEVVLTITCAGFEIGVAPERPAPGAVAATRVREVRSAQGQLRVYTASTTARGMRLLIIEPGEVNRDGLHLMVFDNDDFFAADGRGQLIASATTAPTGMLVEREGPQYGCGCERTTQVDGRAITTPLAPR